MSENDVVNDVYKVTVRLPLDLAGKLASTSFTAFLTNACLDYISENRECPKRERGIVRKDFVLQAAVRKGIMEQCHIYGGTMAAHIVAALRKKTQKEGL